jgi:magnesium-transporting ATPase (P-type)
MDGLVVSTGMNTYFSRTTKLIEVAKTRSHFQKAVVKIGDYLIVLSVARVEALKGYCERDVILYGTLASREENKDPIDDAIIGKGREEELSKDLKKYEATDFKPFDPVKKRTEATIKDPDGRSLKVSKGAPQVILSLVADK